MEDKKYVTWYSDSSTHFGELIDTYVDGTLVVKDPAVMYFTQDEGRMFINFMAYVQKIFYKNTDNIWKIKPEAVLENSELLPEAIANYIACVNVKRKETAETTEKVEG